MKRKSVEMFIQIMKYAKLEPYNEEKTQKTYKNSL